MSVGLTCVLPFLCVGGRVVVQSSCTWLIACSGCAGLRGVDGLRKAHICVCVVDGIRVRPLVLAQPKAVPTSTTTTNTSATMACTRVVMKASSLLASRSTARAGRGAASLRRVAPKIHAASSRSICATVASANPIGKRLVDHRNTSGTLLSRSGRRKSRCKG